MCVHLSNIPVPPSVRPEQMRDDSDDEDSEEEARRRRPGKKKGGHGMDKGKVRLGLNCFDCALFIYVSHTRIR